MALSIGVSAGESITIGPYGPKKEYHTVYVKILTAPNLIVITVDNGPEIVVNDDQKIELLPEVFVQVGIGANGASNRLAFHADRSIKIEKTSRRDRHAHQ